MSSELDEWTGDRGPAPRRVPGSGGTCPHPTRFGFCGLGYSARQALRSARELILLVSLMSLDFTAVRDHVVTSPP